MATAVICKEPRFCCKGKNPQTQECRGSCIPLDYLNDGEKDCPNGSDEGTIGKKKILNVKFKMKSKGFVFKKIVKKNHDFFFKWVKKSIVSIYLLLNLQLWSH